MWHVSMYVTDRTAGIFFVFQVLRLAEVCLCFEELKLLFKWSRNIEKMLESSKAVDT